jgi:anti-sigma B factor antagonist
MPSRLTVSERRVGTVTILELSGELVYDGGTRVLREAVTKAVSEGAGAVLLDLRQLRALDSGGVGALVAMFRHVTRQGGQLKLLRPSATARHVLGIARLTCVFDIFDDEEGALLNLS